MADKKHKIFRKRLVSSPVSFGFSVEKQEQPSGGPPAMAPPKSQETIKIPMELQREADRLLLARYVPPAVLINEHLEILQTRGRTASFLELPSGKASLNLLKMARPGLLFELQGAIDEARKQGFEARRQNVRVGDEQIKTVAIRVIPFKVPTQTQYSFLIVFESETAADGSATTGLSPMPAAEVILEQALRGEHSPLGLQIVQLRQELAATREYLQSIIESQEGTNEELQSANEEIQSGNEELQSTNEELQTSKEELESANEELHTVNEEMQHRNELLTQLNNDLTNLLYSVSLPIVMVGADLSVRRFTPQAAAMLGLTSSDIGRPMPRLRLKLDMGSLEQNMLDVIQQVQSQQLHVQDNEGKWCVLRIVPYRTLDNRIDGVVLSVMNEIGGTPGKPDGVDGKPAGKAQQTKSGKVSRKK
jgi:two-component system CheB/CheR fusion protein